MRATWERYNDVVRVNMNYAQARNWAGEMLLGSDLHVDSDKCQRAELRNCLAEAVDEGIPILLFGDQADAMQGPNDRRGSKSGLLPQLKSDRYLNQLVEMQVEFFAPFAKNIVMIGDGNHETAVRRMTNFDINSAVIHQLNAEHGGKILNGGYTGYVLLRFQQAENTGVRTKVLHYHHGYGGNAARSKGVLRVDIETANRRSADIYVMGHIHQDWRVFRSVEEVTPKGFMKRKRVLHVQLPAWKEHGQWETEKGFQPALVGAYRLKFGWRGADVSFDAVAA